jgi:HD-GYP domain-containing protein (c-di-GMP phosphodiesterase class II)
VLTQQLPHWPVPACPSGRRDGRLRVADVVTALSSALDLSTGQPVGHSVRTCILGMRIAREIGMPTSVQHDLYYALLLKDAGCSSNASTLFQALGSDELKAKRDVKTTDWTRLSWETLQYALTHISPGKPFVERVKAILRTAANQKQQTREVTKIRCERGAFLAGLMGLSTSTGDGIASLDEHWNGAGNPEGLRKTEIPILSRIMLLAQTLEVFRESRDGATALDVIRRRSGRWFDPHLVKAAESLGKRGALWIDVEGERAFSLVTEIEPEHKMMEEGDTTLDSICLAFAQIVDAKSPFTYNHSNGVANAAVAMGRGLGLDTSQVLFLRHAALLHDIGKLSVSNAILEKPGRPDAAEWETLKLHPFYTGKILQGLPGFGRMSEIAASHHEKLDGSGYFRGLTGARIPLEARILVVADIFDALAANRPYRDAMPLDGAFRIMRKDAPHAIDSNCLEALEQSGAGCDQTYIDLNTLSDRLQSKVQNPRVLTV